MFFWFLKTHVAWKCLLSMNILINSGGYEKNSKWIFANNFDWTVITDVAVSFLKWIRSQSLPSHRRRTGTSITFMSREDWRHAKELIAILEEASQEVPEELRGMAERFARRQADGPRRGGGGFRGGGRGGRGWREYWGLAPSWTKCKRVFQSNTTVPLSRLSVEKGRKNHDVIAPFRTRRRCSLHFTLTRGPCVIRQDNPPAENSPLLHNHTCRPLSDLVTKVSAHYGHVHVHVK